MEQLRTIRDDIEVYNAGFPHFPRNFTRDSVISGLLMQDPSLLRNQLLFSARLQGRRADPLTGEEPGKIHHEFPGFTMENGNSTQYNACDTTALYLIGHHQYLLKTGDASLKQAHEESLRLAAQYIRSHLVDYTFYEDPRLCGAEQFGLKVTYWKDSELAKRENGMPAYPVSYFLAHAMNLAGMRSASALLGSDELAKVAERMKERLHKFFDLERRSFYIAIDAQGPVSGVSSDILHALFYLERDDLTGEQVEAIAESSAELETIVGYRTLSPKMVDNVEDPYHSMTVWPFEQAIINAGARKFGLDRIAQVSRQVISHLDTAPETFVISPSGISKGGCDPQLWTIAAKQYFARIDGIPSTLLHEH